MLLWIQFSTWIYLLYTWLYNLLLFLSFLFRPPSTSSSQQKTESPSMKRFTLIREDNSNIPQTSPKLKRASTGSINFSPTTNQEQIVVHPGAVLSIFHLLPAIEQENDSRVCYLYVLPNGQFCLIIGISWNCKNKTIYNLTVGFKIQGNVNVFLWWTRRKKVLFFVLRR